jgi:hypothetical protein
MFERGERGHLVVVEREDYVGRDKVTTDATGRPVMRVEKYVNGQQRDVVVFAPSGQHKIGIDRLADIAPLPVRRKGSSAIHGWAVARIRQLVARSRP